MTLTNAILRCCNGVQLNGAGMVVLLEIPLFFVVLRYDRLENFLWVPRGLSNSVEGLFILTFIVEVAFGSWLLVQLGNNFILAYLVKFSMINDRWKIPMEPS
jgi:hypothetical protein